MACSIERGGPGRDMERNRLSAQFRADTPTRDGMDDTFEGRSFDALQLWKGKKFKVSPSGALSLESCHPAPHFL
jgi:hypothetical protein